MKQKQVFTFGLNNEVEVSVGPKYLRINRHIDQHKFNMGNKVIDLKTITAYSFRPPLKGANGLIHIDYLGNTEEVKNNIDSYINNNCILITVSQYEDAKKFLSCIEGYVDEKYVKGSMPSIADEIIKLHKLYEAKIITKDQLQSQKSKLFD